MKSVWIVSTWIQYEGGEEDNWSVDKVFSTESKARDYLKSKHFSLAPYDEDPDNAYETYLHILSDTSYYINLLLAYPYDHELFEEGAYRHAMIERLVIDE